MKFITICLKIVNQLFKSMGSYFLFGALIPKRNEIFNYYI